MRKLEAFADWALKYRFHCVFAYIVFVLLRILVDDIGTKHAGYVADWGHVFVGALMVLFVAVPAYFAGRQDGRHS